jgi:hypothetical protein
MDEAVSDTERNICATSYVTADNSRSMAYLILKFIYKWKNKDWSIQKLRLFMYKYIYSNTNPNLIRFSKLILGTKVPQ